MGVVVGVVEGAVAAVGVGSLFSPGEVEVALTEDVTSPVEVEYEGDLPPFPECVPGVVGLLVVPTVMF